MIEKWLGKNEAAIVDREFKSDIWKLFGAVEREEKVISNFVACKACKNVYAFKPIDGTQSLRKHNCSENRGLRVYPYPRVYPTRPLVGLLRVVRVTGIPAGRVVKTVYPQTPTIYEVTHGPLTYVLPNRPIVVTYRLITQFYVGLRRVQL